MSTVGRCIVYTGIRLLLLIHPLMSSFFFFSNFQALNFLSHFSQELWGLKDWNLVHTWKSGQMYRVYWNQTAAAYSSLFFIIFLPLQFSNIKIFRHFSQELWGLESWNLVHVWKAVGCIMYTQIMLLHKFILLFFHFSFSLIFKFFVTHFLRNCEA